MLNRHFFIKLYFSEIITNCHTILQRTFENFTIRSL